MANTISQKAMRIQKWVLSLGALLMLFKFVAYFITNSNAILTDALESIVNVTAGGLALYNLWLSAQPRDRKHPYGHGKIEFISSGIEGALILGAGALMIGKAIYNFIFPIAVHNLDIGILITGLAGIFNYVLGFITERYGKTHSSIVLEAEGKHLKSDAYSTAGMLLGLGVIYFTDLIWLDNVIAIIFGLVIAYTGYKILARSIGGIMDEADMELLEKIIKIVNENRRENWIDLHNLRVIQYGHQLHIDAHLTIPWYMNIADGHEEMEKLDQLINDSIDRPIEFFIHTDPCIPASCQICTKASCEVRKHPLKQKVEWTLDNVLKDTKHRFESKK
jgi:cation diffusion facilitator family transporter